MRIFIVYASAGFGHKKVAESINEIAVDVYGKNSIRLLDILDFTNPFFRFLSSAGYTFVISKLKWLWKIIFYSADLNYFNLNNSFGYLFYKLFFFRLVDLVKNEQPDIIVSAHFTANQIVSFLKEKKQISSKIISVITDFGVHNLWVAKNIDIYAVASNATKEILVSRNIKEDKIRTFGIPVRKQFQKQIDKKAVRDKLGIKNSQFTVLILTGGIGIGPIYEIVKVFNDEVNVIVVCGNNKKLYNRLQKLNYSNLVALGWIDYVEEVMGISDMVITKPGGSTISECLVMNLPMFFFSIIPGQEFQNAKIISKYGIGFILSEPKEIKEKVLYFRNNPQEVSALRDKIYSLGIQNSSRKIIELINEL